MRNIVYLLFFICSIGYGQTIVLSDSDIKAFPTAIGHGKDATGGRGENTYQVTNLNNSGAGSLRQAIADAKSNSGGIIIFTVGGTITLSSDIEIDFDDVTIAGETASGDGITVYGEQFLINDANNVIVRHIRTRLGDPSYDTNSDSFQIKNTTGGDTMEDIIVDHVSISWGDDGSLDITATNAGGNILQNVTIQNCIISESFKNGYGSLMSYNILNISVIGNYFASNNQRSFANSDSECSLEVINNLIYNFYEATEFTTNTDHDHIGNVYKDGPNYVATKTFKLEKCSAENCGTEIESGAGTEWYIDDNTLDGSPISEGAGRYAHEAESPTRVVSSGYTPLSSSVVADSVLAKAGARNGVTWDGSGDLDDLDAEMIADYGADTGTARTTAESGTSGLPTLSSGTAYDDDDDDGLSDDYELDQGGTITSISATTRPSTAVIDDGTTIDQSGVTNYATEGYTHLDIFLADLANDWEQFNPSNPPIESLTSFGTGKLRIGTGIGGAYLGTVKIN